jgi:hypothetical protein
MHHQSSKLPKYIFSPTAENNAPLQSLSKDKKNLQSNTCKSENVHPNLEKKLSWVEYVLQI